MKFNQMFFGLSIMAAGVVAITIPSNSLAASRAVASNRAVNHTASHNETIRVATNEPLVLAANVKSSGKTPSSMHGKKTSNSTSPTTKKSLHKGLKHKMKSKKTVS